jgi:hypothetical protein
MALPHTASAAEADLRHDGVETRDDERVAHVLVHLREVHEEVPGLVDQALRLSEKSC